MLEESPLPLTGVWDGALLQPIAEINLRLLESLHRRALELGEPAGTGGTDGVVRDAVREQWHDVMRERLRGEPRAGSPGEVHAAARLQAAPRLVYALCSQWRRLDDVAQQRLAACPYLLLDGGFGQPQRWQRPAWLPQSEIGAAARAATLAEATTPDGYFGGADGVALVRRALVFAWHLARANRLGARVLLGMDALAAERIAAARLQDLDALAERSPPWIVPRWEQRPGIWRQLLQAACDGSPGRLRLAQQRGLQLLAAEPIGPAAA